MLGAAILFAGLLVFVVAGSCCCGGGGGASGAATVIVAGAEVVTDDDEEEEVVLLIPFDENSVEFRQTIDEERDCCDLCALSLEEPLRDLGPL